MAKRTLLYSFFAFFLTLSSATVSCAQEGTAEMADAMRADGKIWVVVAVLAIIFAGIFAYLIRLDRKITRLERETK